MERIPPRNLQPFLERLLGAHGQAVVTISDCGALDVTIHHGGQTSVLEVSPAWDQFGLTPAVERDDGFLPGHSSTFGDYHAALAALVDIVRPEGLTDREIDDLARRVNALLDLPTIASGDGS